MAPMAAQECPSARAIDTASASRRWRSTISAGGLVARDTFQGNTLYDSYVTELAVSEARDHFAEVIEQARSSGEPVYVTRHGRRVAVIVDAETYDAVVEKAEDATDRRELKAARDDGAYVPWEAVKADLGLG